MSRKRKKKKSLRNTLINIVATLLIILSLLLIFNAPIRNMIMVWHTNQYQVSKVDKKPLTRIKK
ncbi:Sortase A, LPXTG specific [Streptococcus sp. ZB199]|nr:Sortase A, LPXTG specific [Streptococcus sp. ZB199]